MRLLAAMPSELISSFKLKGKWREEDEGEWKEGKKGSFEGGRWRRLGRSIEQKIRKKER
jgi:hypothetical protein